VDFILIIIIFCLEDPLGVEILAVSLGTRLSILQLSHQVPSNSTVESIHYTQTLHFHNLCVNWLAKLQ
jgi:hypothetical protein